MSEEWRVVVGHPDYEVSSLGNVRNAKFDRPKKLSHDVYGYHQVSLGRGVTRKVHILVLEAFVGPRGEGQETRHLNGVRDDNRLENLCWGDSKTNQADRLLHGTSNDGERSPTAKLSVEDVQKIRTKYQIGDASALAAEYGVSASNITTIVRRQTWKHV